MSTTAAERTSFINLIAKPAVKDYERTNILPSLIIAQAILESGWGKGRLAKNANNIFSIRGAYKGESVMEDDDDVDIFGNRHPVLVPFKKYPSVAEALQDHADTLLKDRYKRVIQAKDYKQGAQALYDCGYAGDPQYPAKLIEIIEKYKLHEYDPVEIYHTVASGDYVSVLAKKYGRSLEEIKKWNNLNDKYAIKIGQKIRVK